MLSRYYTRKLLCLILMIVKLHNANALYCYSCSHKIGNWKCNEAEPTMCAKDEVCVTIKTITLFKKCMKECPVSRGDGGSVPCQSCTGNLCNEFDIDEEHQPLKPRQYPVTDRYGTSFILHVRMSTFWSARMKCAEDGGMLATIHSHEAHEFIVDNFVENSGAARIMEMAPGELNEKTTLDPGSFWIGLRRFTTNKKNKSVWMWTDDGSVVEKGTSACNKSNIFRANYTNWYHGRPVTLKGEHQLCGSVSRSRDGRWRGLSCGKILPGYLCQYPEDKIQQSTLHNSTVYTYTQSHMTDSQLPKNCELVRPNGELTKRGNEWFGYTNSSRKCNEESGEKVPGACVSRTTAIICKRSIEIDCKDENFNLLQNLSSSEEMSPTTLRNNTPSGVLHSSHKKFCESYVKHNELEILSFAQTFIRRFAYSEEKCTDGRPKGMVFCGTQPVVGFKNVARLDCKMDINDTWNKIVNKKDNYTMKNLHKAMLFGDDLNLYNLSALVSILSSKSDMESKITATDFRDVIAIIGKLRRLFSRQRNNQSFHHVSQKYKSSLDNTLEEFASHVTLGSNELRASFTTDGIEMEVVKLDTLSSEDEQALLYEHTTSDLSSTIRLTLPFQSRSRLSNQRHLRAVFMSYDDDELFPTEEDVHVYSVISATITDGNTTYSVPVEFSMQISHDINVSSETCVKKECRFYDHSEQLWKTDGCRMESEAGNIVKCICDHTTSFAVVVSQHAKPNYALDVVSTIGLSLCIVCLVLTIAIFVFTPELRRVRSALTHINLCLCLAIAYLVFLIGVEMTSNRYVCVTIAALIHFFLIAAWGWMAVESLTMYRMFVRAFDRRKNKENPKMAFLVYAIAFVVVFVTMSFSILFYYKGWDTGTGCQNDAWSTYVSENYCWLQGNSLYFGFLMIVGIALAFNICLSVVIIKAITWGRKSVQSSVEEKPTIHVLRAVLVALLLGVTWIFAVPLVISNDPVVQAVFGWLFALTTVSQGIFIFYFFCLRREDVRQSWTRAFVRMFTSKQSESDHIVNMNKIATSQLPSTNPHFNNHKTLSLSVSDATARTAVSCSASFKSPGKSPKTNFNKCSYKPDKMDDAKSMDHSIDMVEFTGEDVFDS